MNRALFIFLAVAVVFSMATPAQAQFARAELTGTVMDPEGLVLPGAAVTVTNEGTGISRTTVTGENGKYVLQGLTPSTYTLEVTMDAFKSYRREGVILAVGQNITLDVQLELGGIEETVTVTAESPIVELTSKEVGAAVNDDDFTQLPTQNRSFVMFASLAPGVIPNPSTESTASDSLFINGQDDNNNSFNVDGANNDDDVIGARAGAQTRTAIEAIQEFQILTSQFDAEFGRTQGGVLNAVTKSGTNQFQGTGFLYLQDSSMNKKSFFAERNNLDKPDYNYMSIGGVLGGPIVRDKAHFFVSFERNTPNNGIVQSFETRPELNYTTTVDNLIRNWLWKADWQVAEKHRFAARFLWEYSPQFNQVVDSRMTLNAIREEDDTDMSFISSLDSVLSDNAFNNLRVSYTREDVSFANPGYNNNGKTFAAQRALDVSEDRPSVLDGASDVAQSRINNSYQFDDTFSYYKPGWGGDHNFRMGFNYSRRSEWFYNAGTANGQFDFDVDQVWNRNLLVTYPEFYTVRVIGPADQNIPANNVYGFFFQDDWNPGHNVTLNLGVRYDRESISNDNNNIGPRVGITWDPVGDGKTVLRGGWGRFYERFQLGDYSSFFLDAVELDRGFLRRFPESGSNKDLFWNIVQENNINSLNELRTYLNNMIEGGTGTLLNISPTVDNPDRKEGYADTFSAGVQREISPGLAFVVDFVRTQNRDIKQTLDLNPYSRAQGGRPNISILNGQQLSGMSSITSWWNGGETNYTALQLSLQRRFRDSPIGRFSGRISYTLAKQSGNADAGFGTSRFQYRTETGYNFDTGQWLGEDPDPNIDDPQNVGRPSVWHRDHNFVTSWSWLLPRTSWRASSGLQFSGVFRYMKGSRFTMDLRELHGQ